MKYNIPSNWVIVKLDEICKVVTDGTHKTPKYIDSGVPFISIANIRPFEEINFKKYKKYISKEEHEELSKRAKPEFDDILFPRIGTLGYAKRIDFNYEVSIFVGLGLIKPFKEFVSPKLLEFYLNTPFVNKYSFEKATGTGRLTLPLEESRKLPVTLPPLNEQHRIVSKIEELFSDLDNGVSNLKLAQNQLKVYRQALLKQGFEGKLTQQWRKENNPESAEKLLERIRTDHHQRYQQELKDWKAAVKEWEKQSKRGRKPRKPNKPIEVSNLNSELLLNKAKLPTSWLYNVLISVIEMPKYGTSRKCTYDNSGTAVLRIPNLKSGIIDEEDLKYAFFTEDEKEPYLLKEGDILTIRSNGSVDLVGRCSIIRKMNTDKLYAGYLIRLRPLANIVDSRYLLNVLESQDLRTQIVLKAKSTSGVNNINSGELSSLIIPLCSKGEQTKIADLIESRFSVIDNLELTIESGLQKSEALRQSILKMAFEGKLVPQDPKDDPAWELLKRIQAAKKKYLEEQKQLKKRIPKKTKKMIKELSIEEVLATSDNPMLAIDVWQKCKHKENIEDFYKELKEIQSKIKEVKKGTESLLSLAK
ncbi:restriction endonuclease subunit S [Flagellimonas sp.]|uniref:restriction endonuclease subunit S n=1 Tax=Flagellimonas sp. TaxID=2058762 RepID=UPI003BAE73AF